MQKGKFNFHMEISAAEEKERNKRNVLFDRAESLNIFSRLAAASITCVCWSNIQWMLCRSGRRRQLQFDLTDNKER